jgi:hypothetical protein
MENTGAFHVSPSEPAHNTNHEKRKGVSGALKTFSVPEKVFAKTEEGVSASGKVADNIEKVLSRTDKGTVAARTETERGAKIISGQDWLWKKYCLPACLPAQVARQTCAIRLIFQQFSR